MFVLEEELFTYAGNTKRIPQNRDEAEKVKPTGSGGRRNEMTK